MLDRSHMIKREFERRNLAPHSEAFTPELRECNLPTALNGTSSKIERIQKAGRATRCASAMRSRGDSFACVNKGLRTPGTARYPAGANSSMRCLPVMVAVVLDSRYKFLEQTREFCNIVFLPFFKYRDSYPLASSIDSRD
jgi:hypothetical protein